MERRLGRMIRSMSLGKMGHFADSRGWSPAVDVFESDEEVLIYMDVSGVNAEEISITFEKNNLTISGERVFPVQNLCCIHQLEIDYGPFMRTISLPVGVDIEKTTSSCTNGVLIVHLPKKAQQGKITIKVS